MIFSGFNICGCLRKKNLDQVAPISTKEGLDKNALSNKAATEASYRYNNDNNVLAKIIEQHSSKEIPINDQVFVRIAGDNNVRPSIAPDSIVDSMKLMGHSSVKTHEIKTILQSSAPYALVKKISEKMSRSVAQSDVTALNAINATNITIKSLSCLVSEGLSRKISDLSRNMHNLELNIENVSTGNVALDRMFHNSYDCVILDIEIPIMDGIEIIKRLRDFERITPGRSPHYVIGVSAELHRTEVALQTGFDVVLTKPLNVNELISIIESLFTD